LLVSELALGTGMFGKTWGSDAEPDEVRSILQGSVETGGTCLDTADSSQHGRLETLSVMPPPRPLYLATALRDHAFLSLNSQFTCS
jgi:hypothetical protein